MTRLDPAPGRQREKLVGAVVVLVGIAVLVLSVVALVGAASGAESDVGGSTFTLPAASSSATPSTSGSATSSPSSTSPSTSPSTSASSSASSSSSSSSGTAAAGRQPLVILNNTSQGGLAQTAAATFTQGGWAVTSTANFTGDILSTCAYYDPDVAGAQAAAESLMQQFPAVKRVREKFGGLPDGPVVVVLTSDYTAR